MRRIIAFSCEGAVLAGTLDEAPGTTGLLIVSGGNEIRIGAHRGMAMLAADLARAGHPVMRFDRRGIGDSEGDNGGFLSSGPDIAAAVERFRAGCPHLKRVVAFGNCDAASALALHGLAGIHGYVLANPWVIEASTEAPAQAAVKAHYWQRIRDPGAWRRLFTGAINFRKLATGLGRAARTEAPSALAEIVAIGMAKLPPPLHILLAARDGTAVAFAAEWEKSAFAKARSHAHVTRIDSPSHSFAGDADYVVLMETLFATLK